LAFQLVVKKEEGMVYEKVVESVEKLAEWMGEQSVA
jgi:hypothetical protein